MVPAEWVEGVARLRTMPRPAALDADDWALLVADAERFLHDWGVTAAHLSWPAWALFGIHRRVPASWRGRELVALLGGRLVVALTAAEAVIEVRPGVRHTYLLPPRDDPPCDSLRDPLSPAERALLWELEG